jgi:hypothetical protein
MVSSNMSVLIAAIKQRQVKNFEKGSEDRCLSGLSSERPPDHLMEPSGQDGLNYCNIPHLESPIGCTILVTQF